MNFGMQVYVIPALLSGAISLALAIYLLRRERPVFDVRGLVAYLGTSGIVSFLFVGIILALEKYVMILMLSATFTMILVGALGLLHFALAFSNRLNALTRPIVLALATVTTVLIGALWTDPIHHTFRSEVKLYREPVRIINAVYGPIGQFGVLYLFGVTLVSAYVIVDHLYRSESLYRTQGLMVATAVLLPITGSALSVANWPHPAINVTPIFTVLSGVLFTGAIAKYHFLDIVPLAYEEVVESMEDSVIVTNPSGTILSLNRQATLLIDEQDPIGLPVSDVLPGAARNRNESGDNDEQHRWKGDITVQRGSTERILEVQSVPIQANNGRLLGRAITLRDITELKRREETLKRQNQRLDQFASVVSHDLRNPLNVAHGYTELIAQEREDEHADAVLDALSRMETMIDEMMTLARSGRDIETTEPCLLRDIVRKSWNNVRTDGAELDSQVENATIHADPTRLLHVFENLFRNAIEHNDRPVTIRVGMLDTPGGFYVEDSGDGIPEEERQDIFSHGYTTSDQGTGLGLSIVGDIVEAHGWRITVTESDYGGARFEVRIG